MHFIEQLKENFILSSLYDILKFFVSYLFARWLYDGVYKNWRWGGWQIKVVRGDEVLTTRTMSPERAKMILQDDNDLSVFLKGIVSPHGWLNIDICSERAKREGLLMIDHSKKIITVDLSKNPPAPDEARSSSSHKIKG